MWHAPTQGWECYKRKFVESLIMGVLQIGIWADDKRVFVWCDPAYVAEYVTTWYQRSNFQHWACMGPLAEHRSEITKFARKLFDKMSRKFRLQIV